MNAKVMRLRMYIAGLVVAMAPWVGHYLLFKYLVGNADAVLWILSGIVVWGGAYAVYAYRERKRNNIRVRLTIDASDCVPYRAEVPYDPDIRKAYEDWRKGISAQWDSAGSDRSMQKEVTRKRNRVWPVLYWHYLFLGNPTDPRTLVWAITQKDYLWNEHLVYDRLWRRVLAGTEARKKEAFFVVKLNYAEEVLHIHLVPQKVDGRPAKPPITLCKFPLVLLTPAKLSNMAAILAAYGLERDEGSVDVYKDDQGEYQVHYSNGVGNIVYKHSMFKFTVNIVEGVGRV